MNEKKNDNAKKDTSGKMNVKMSSETGRTQTPVNNAGKKSKTKFGGLMYFIFVVSVSVILACLAWSAATDVLALKSDDVQATIVLEKDSFQYFLTIHSAASESAFFCANAAAAAMVCCGDSPDTCLRNAVISSLSRVPSVSSSLSSDASPVTLTLLPLLIFLC